MEKMKFGTGGQPVALEDLELLQDNAQMLGLLVLESLIDGKAQQFLMRKITTTYQVLESDRVKVALSGGVLVANGELYHFAPADLTLANLSAPVYLCLQRTEADTRRFENNENKSCRVKYSVTLLTRVIPILTLGLLKLISIQVAILQRLRLSLLVFTM